MLRNKYDYDILVIGGGAAGMHAALLLAAEGKRIGLCEPGELGGHELREGYGMRAPLVESARLFAEIRGSAERGIRGGSVGYNYPTLRAWSKDRTVVKPSSASQLAHAGVDVHAGAARFIGAHEVTLGRRRLSAAQFLVCTGSAAVVPPSIAGLQTVAYLTPQTAVDLLKPPKSLFIIGGGKTGTELAGLFSSFGTNVLIADIAPRLLPAEDPAAGDAVKAELESRGGEVLTSARITSVTKDGTSHRITYLRGDVEHVVRAERVLLAAGRAPLVHIGLENADVEYSPLGIVTTPTLQTNVKHIYAAGSVTGNVVNAEGAVLEAETAATNMLRRDKTPASYAAVPSVTYSQPVVARVGVNEGDALRRDITVRTVTIEVADTVYGHAHPSPGSVTLVADRKGVLIGATIIGNGGADEIGLLTIAIDAGLTADNLARLGHAHGSLGEAVTRAARELAQA